MVMKGKTILKKQEKKEKRKGIFTFFAELLQPRFPDLRKKLHMGELKQSPVEFLETVVSSTFFVSLAVLFVIALIFYDPLENLMRTNVPAFALAVIAVLAAVPLIIGSYFMLYPSVAIVKRKKELDYEVVFAARHILIALKSGMPLFECFVGASRGYGAISREFTNIVDKILLGIPMTQAIRESVQDNPSKYFNRIMMQMANSISSGADISESLESVLEQISKEQTIALKEYSQKLTPIVMFYMIFGIIIPSLGIVLTVVVFSAVSGGMFGINSSILLPLLAIIGLVQFLFLGIMENSRPKYLI